MLRPEVAQHIPEIRALCRRFGVTRLEIFGSAVTGDFDPHRSDVDFVVTWPEAYDSGPWGSRYTEFDEQLSSILGREVDLVFNKPHRNRFFARDIDRTRQEIYIADTGDTPMPLKITPVEPRPTHQRTLKLLEDIRLSCVDVESFAHEIAKRSSLSGRLAHDATAWSIQKTGRACQRLEDADAETAVRIHGLDTLKELSEQLAYGSGIDVESATLQDAMHSIIPGIRETVTKLIECLERDEGDSAIKTPS